MKSEELYLFELPQTCSVAGCERLIQNKRDRLCGRHYTRAWRYGDPLAGGALRDRSGAGHPVVDFPDGTRQCNECGARLPLEHFHKDANNTAGRRSHCAECHKAKARAWYAANRERQAQREKDRRAADPERYRRYDMERYERDREKRIELATQHAHQRRLRLKAAEHDRTVTRANLRKQYGDDCFYCGRGMDFGRYRRGETPDDLASIEHVVPISLGGTHTWDNVVLCCLRCNLQKNRKPVDEWLAERAMSS